MTNLAYATGSFNIKSIISPSAIAIVHYEQPIKKEEHNEEDNYGGPGYGSYGGAVIPMIPGPMYGSPMYGNEPYGPTEAPNSVSYVHKTKTDLSKHKHKHKHHTTKHHTTAKNHSKQRT